MKKQLCFIAMFISCVFLFSEEHIVFRGNCFIYNDIYKRLQNQEYQIKYDDSKNVFYFYSSFFGIKTWIYLNRNNFTKMRTIFEKYFEWEDTAIKNKVTVNRDIPDSRINQSVSWTSGTYWYSSNRLSFAFKLFSQTETRHQLIMSFSQVTSDYLDYQIDSLYFDKSQVRTLYNAISDTNITKELDAIKKKKESVDSLFN
jgi:hypothetical protein